MFLKQWYLIFFFFEMCPFSCHPLATKDTRPWKGKRNTDILINPVIMFRNADFLDLELQLGRSVSDILGIVNHAENNIKTILFRNIINKSRSTSNPRVVIFLLHLKAAKHSCC